MAAGHPVGAPDFLIWATIHDRAIYDVFRRDFHTRHNLKTLHPQPTSRHPDPISKCTSDITDILNVGDYLTNPARSWSPYHRMVTFRCSRIPTDERVATALVNEILRRLAS